MKFERAWERIAILLMFKWQRTKVKKAKKRSKELLILALSFSLSFFSASAGTIETKKAGNWNKPSVWRGGSTPGPSDDVLIKHDITLTGTDSFTVQLLKIEGGSLTLNSGSHVEIDSNLVILAIYQSSGFFMNDSSSVSVKMNLVMSAVQDTGKAQFNDNSRIEIMGNIDRTALNGGNIFKFNNNSSLELNGSQQQNLPAKGDDVRLENVIINNSYHSQPNVSLNGDVSINGTLNLMNGVIAADTTSKELTIEDGAFLKGVDTSNFINGPIYKAGDDSFTFKYSTGKEVVQLKISAPDSQSTFRAYYRQKDPRSIFGSVKDSSLAVVSGVEYWQLDRTEGSGDIQVTFYWNNADSSGVYDLNDLRLVKYDNAQSKWVNLGIDTAVWTNGSRGPGWVRSDTIRNFSPITLGSTSTNNPLPVEWLDFKVEKLDNKAELRWVTAQEVNNSHFIIQRRSENENTFENIGRVEGNGNTNSKSFYTFLDSEKLNRTYYYRIKQLDFSGDFNFSKIKKITFDNPIQLSAYPNPGGNNIYIQGDFNENSSLELRNSSGMLLEKTSVQPGTSGKYYLKNILVSWTSINSGVYYLNLINARQEVTIKLIKMD